MKEKMEELKSHKKNKPNMNHPWRQQGIGSIESTQTYRKKKKSKFPIGLAKLKPFKGKRELEEIDEEKTRDYFVNLYRNCKD